MDHYFLTRSQLFRLALRTSRPLLLAALIFPVFFTAVQADNVPETLPDIVVIEAPVPGPEVGCTGGAEEEGVEDTDNWVCQEAALGQGESSARATLPEDSVISEAPADGPAPRLLQRDAEAPMSLSAMEAPGTLAASLESFNSQIFPFLFLNMRVSDNGAPALGLTTENFSCTEDGRPQTDYFAVAPPESGSAVRLADIVFLIDASGSMDVAIAGVKNNVSAFATQLAGSAVDFRLGLVQFGQSASGGAPLLKNGGSLTADVDLFKSWVAAVPTDGGYEPSFLALRSAAQQMSFRPGAQKIFVLITNEDSDDRDKASTISALQTGSITLHVAADCNSGASQTDFCDATSVRAATGGQLFSVAGPYSQVLTSIAEATASTYILRYKTDNPALDSALRQVSCTAYSPSGQASVTTNYTPGGAPMIHLTDTTRELFLQPRSEDVAVKISATVTDAVTPFVPTTGVKLYYRTTGGTYVATPMTKASDGTYEATIPATAVKRPALEFYITAADGQSLSTLPITDAADLPFEIAVLPNALPEIVHTPVTTAYEDKLLTISAAITDSTNSVASATLYYRQTGEITYGALPMTLTDGQYRATIPAERMTANIEYYLSATDDLNTTTRFPQQEPLVIELIKIDPLILKYEPILYLHDNENFKPMAVEPYVAHSSLWDASYGDEKVEGVSNPLSINDLETTANSTNWYLQFTNIDAPKSLDVGLATAEYQGLTTEEKKPTYYARKMMDSFVDDEGKLHDYIVLQYWYFYVLNDWKAHGGQNNHEGDWESVFVFLDKVTEEPVYVAFSAHHNRGEETAVVSYDSVRRPWQSNEVEKDLNNPNHVISFVALGSHANYPLNNNGEHMVRIIPNVKSEIDRTSLNGFHVNANMWDSGNRLIITGNSPDWVYKYSGMWGTDTNIPGFDGPLGPNFSGVGGTIRFLNPIEWAGLDKIFEKIIEEESVSTLDLTKQRAKLLFDKALEIGTKIGVSLHDEYISFGENLEDISLLPHFWDIESSLENGTFNTEVSLSYDANELSVFGITESYLSAFYFNPVTNIWEVTPSTVDIANDTVSFFTNHFSRYAIGVIKDDIAPITTATVTGTEGSNGWYQSDATVILTAEDNAGGSGIQTTKYSLDSGTTWAPYTAPLSFTQEGTSELQFFSTDNAGNAEAPQTLTIKIDKTAPAVPARPTASATATTSITLAWPAAADATSGIASYTIFRNGVSVGNTADLSYTDAGLTPATSYTYILKATDVAGNTSAASASRTVATKSVPKSISFTSSVTSVNGHTSATLNWNVTGFTSCTGSGGWSGAKALSGTMTVSPVTTTTYILTCKSGSSTAQSSVTVSTGSSSNSSSSGTGGSGGWGW